MTLPHRFAAELSSHVYGKDPPPLKPEETFWRTDRSTGEERQFIILQVKDNPRTGYQGAIYQDIASGELIVVHRGTEFDREPLKDGALADGGMVAARVNSQLPDAMDLTRRAVEMARRSPLADGSERAVSVTGHSLGGTFAQATAYHFDLRGQTFNAYGAIGINGIPADASANVVNHVRASDPVSSANRHIGTEVRYATREDAAATASLTAFLATGLPAHRMSSFLGEDSALTADARQRAERFDALFDLRRDQIALMRGGVTLASELHLRQREVLGHAVGGGLDAAGQGAEAAARGGGRLQSQWTATVAEGGAISVRAGTEVSAFAHQGAARAVGGAVRWGGELSATRDEALADVARLAEWAVPSWTGLSSHYEARAERTRQQSQQAAVSLVEASDARADAVRHGGREFASVIRDKGTALAGEQEAAAGRLGEAIRAPLRDAAQGVRDASARPQGPDYREPAPLLLVSDRRHPQFDIYAGALRGIEAMPTRPAEPAGRERLAAALAQQAHHEGFDRIDHVLASRDGQRVFAVEGRLGDPAAAIASVPATAERQPLSQSTQRIDDTQAREAAETLAAPVRALSR